ncbi:hypothetical protein CY35_16G056400 [Sphagnum magellanicum]|nr:hypothetical protein CY35_16G056400 [Sphagnum magellanicum]
MSYITDRLLAMSFPAQNMESLVRNPMWQVQRVLELRHESHYKVYNLCAEATYDSELFHGRVELVPFDDNFVPPLALIKLFCESVNDWLSSDPRNVAVIHCRAGKGRTGLMVCAYLVYTGMRAEDALQLYADRRTYNNQGVTIASQRRYVGYWGKLLACSSENQLGLPQIELPETRHRELRRIRLYDTLSNDHVKFVISELKKIPGQLYSPAAEVAQGFCKALKKGFHRTISPRYFLSFLPRKDDDEEKKPRLVVQMDTEKPVSYMRPCLDYQFDQPLIVSGDIRAVFYDKSGGHLFNVCFNTFFISNSMLQFNRGELDKLGRRGKTICGPGFCLELLFGPVEPQVPSPHSRNLEDSVELL